MFPVVADFPWRAASTVSTTDTAKLQPCQLKQPGKWICRFTSLTLLAHQRYLKQMMPFYHILAAVYYLSLWVKVLFGHELCALLLTIEGFWCGDGLCYMPFVMSLPHLCIHVCEDHTYSHKIGLELVWVTEYWPSYATATSKTAGETCLLSWLGPPYCCIGFCWLVHKNKLFSSVYFQLITEFETWKSMHFCVIWR